jgi:hypothetical protein
MVVAKANHIVFFTLGDCPADVIKMIHGEGFPAQF